MSQVATIEPQRRSLLADMAGRYNMEPQAFANTLRATVVPRNATNEEFAAFLMVAREYSLNPITKEIYAFPKQGGGIQPIVSVDGWANLINSHPQCDGITFQDHLDDKGNVAAITCRIHRKDRTHSTEATEYMAECKRDTSTWKQWPRRMLRHKALIQAARYTFGFAGIVDPDEAERFTSAPKNHGYTQPPTAALAPPSPPPAPVTERVQEIVDAPTEEETRVIDNQDAAGLPADQLADWVSDRIAEADGCKSASELEEIDNQVCRQTDDAQREDLRAQWNTAYTRNKARFGKKK